VKCNLFLLSGLAVSLVGAISPSLPGQDAPVYLDKNAALESRVSDLLGRLTEDEKISLLGGATICTTAAIPRLQVPSLRMADAGAGVRGIDPSNKGPASLFTCGVMMASTWDPELVGRAAAAIGEEARNKGMGSQVLLGPAVNIQRSPLGGRNGEYFSEDPFLAARMAVGYIQGMQGEGTAACIKHFACNNEEVDRGAVNVQVSERALREIYLPAFAAGVKEGHVWAVMSSYNRVNGPHSSANGYLLTDILKKGWGFDGMVMSDWGGVHAVAATLNAGNDLEMPGPPRFLNPANVRLALQNGQTTQAAIDEAVRRTLRTIIRTGLLDGPWKTNPAALNTPEHQKLTREIAEQGIVLLKNEGHLLPLDTSKIHSIAVLGPSAREMQMGALGSPYVTPFYSVGPLDGITKRARNKITINYVAEDRSDALTPIPASALTPAGGAAGSGWSGEYFSNPDLQGTPLETRTDPVVNFTWTGQPVGIPGIGPDNFSVCWTASLNAPLTGRYHLAFTAAGGCRLYLDGKLIIDHWRPNGPGTQPAEVDLVAGKSYTIRAEYFQFGGAAGAQLQWTLPPNDHREEAVAAAKKSDVAIVFVSTYKTEGEGHDRPSMSLPDQQDALVQAIAAVNPRTIVVLNNGNPVDMRPWIDQVPGLLEAWFPGQEGGNAIASILFGDVNPSGKLPTTLGARREDYPDDGNFPGIKHRVSYAEGIYVGYRHFDKEKIAPLFPFGYGLSYTTFAYGPLRLSSPTLAPDGKLIVSLPVKNTGSRAGREVVELYLHDPAPKIDKAVRELKGFAKVDLQPGETKTVSLPITPRDLAYFDVPGRQWKADAGDYEIQIGASSRDIRRKATVRLAASYTEAVPLSADQLALNGGFGPAAARDLAVGHPAQSSSASANAGPEKAVDNDDTTAWNSQPGDLQWLMVDLGAPTVINRVRIFWGDAYALNYEVQVSNNGQAWTDMAGISKGMGDIEWTRFAPTPARWVRVRATRPGTTRAGYSIDSFEVYGPEPGTGSAP
jgi:beta-glucosidase